MKTKLFLVLYVTLLAIAQGAWAQDEFITDVMLIGQDETNVNTLKDQYTQAGWTVIDYDLNKGAGGEFIYLLYKTNNSTGSSSTPINGLCIHVSSDRPDSFTRGGRTYTLAPCAGSSHFLGNKGDLNSGVIGTTDMNLYYVKEENSPVRVTSISIDNISTGALGGDDYAIPFDLNDGVSGDNHIYMHVGRAIDNPAFVYNDGQLYDATTVNNANICLRADIALTQRVAIPEGKTVTLDLNGHTLQRTEEGYHWYYMVIHLLGNATLTVNDGSGTNSGRITGGHAYGGGGIYCEPGSKLTFNGGTIIGNSVRNDPDGGAGFGGAVLVNENAEATFNGGMILGNGAPQGGGIYNQGTVTIGNVVISGNTGNDGGAIFNSGTLNIQAGSITDNQVNVHGGGGVTNYGTINMTGGSITNNKTVKAGGGIWQGGTMNVQGNPVVKGNTSAANGTDNVFLNGNHIINVTGAFTGSAHIGVYPASTTATLTSGYGANNPGASATDFLSSDLSLQLSLDGGEVKQTTPSGQIYYFHRSWDEDLKKVVSQKVFVTGQNLNSLSDDDHKLSGTWYATGEVEIDGVLEPDGVLDIVLCDGADLKVESINVHGENKVRIFGQEMDGGKLTIDDPADFSPAIGPIKNHTVGYIEIHGGTIKTEGDDDGAAAIGGGFLSNSSYSHIGAIDIYGGTITAQGGHGAAGIGGGFYSTEGTVNIYGGTITAVGGGAYFNFAGGGGAGIGGGSRSAISAVNIYGGYIKATGSSDAAGIGAGEDAPNDGGEINIHGGTVIAQGAKYGAGIGGGDGVRPGPITITGGTVYAYAGTNAAGIGGGEGGESGNITISGGTVRAYGDRNSDDSGNSGYGSGIGSGQSASCNTIVISGGDIEAWGGEDGAGIGTGEEYTGNIYAGHIYFYGGTVKAYGKGYGAGIGAGEDANAGWVYFYGGDITATAGSDCDIWSGSIGGYHSNSDHDYGEKCRQGLYGYGRINIGDGMRLVTWYASGDSPHYENVSANDDRYIYMHARYWAHVYQCSHTSNTYVDNHDGTHSITSCAYCHPGREPHILDCNGNCTVCSYGHLHLFDKDVNSYAISSNIGQTKDVTLQNRTLYKDGDWNTLCLPFDVTLEGSALEGAEARTLSEATFNDGTLTLNFSDPVETLTAGTPYIMKWKEESADLVIRTAADWDAFANSVNSGNSFRGKLVILDADIEVSTMVGTTYNGFEGTFDGGGHTLTFNYGTAEDPYYDILYSCGPFSRVNNATIANLHTAGTIYTRSSNGAGIVGGINVNTTISNCWSSVNINSAVDGAGNHGGIIGSIYYDKGGAPISITNCLFDGSINGPKTNSCGGLVGENYGFVILNNCLFRPTSITLAENSNNATFSRGNNVTVNNCYYSQNLPGASGQGTAIGTMTNGQLASELGSGWKVKDGKVIPIPVKTTITPGLMDPVFSNVTINAAEPARITPGLAPGTEGDGCVTFCGTYDPVEIGPEGDNTKLYFSTGSTLYWPNGAMTINPFRAYLQLNGATAAKTRAYVINFGDEETTGIVEIVNSNSSNSKHLDDSWYDMSGRKLDGKPAQRGIYIMNGRKYIKK